MMYSENPGPRYNFVTEVQYNLNRQGTFNDNEILAFTAYPGDGTIGPNVEKGPIWPPGVRVDGVLGTITAC